MKFEDNIDKILIISLGENKNLWKHIDKIYYENEVKYFEAYLNERDKYKKEKSRYPAKVEEYINKVIGIYELGTKEKDLSNFISIIKRGYNKIYRSCSNVKKLDTRKLYSRINKDKKTYDISENEAKEMYAVIFYLVKYFNIEIEGNINTHRIELIEYILQEADDIQLKIKSLVDTLGDDIKEDYEPLYIETKDIYRPIELDKLIYKIVYNSMDKRCKLIFGESIENSTPEMVRFIEKETNLHEDTKIAHMIAAYMKFFLANDIEIRSFISDIKIDKSTIDYILSYSALMKVSFDICLEDNENRLLFTSLLYMYAIIQHYKELKYEYVDTSKEEFYLKLKEKEKHIENIEKETNNKIIKYEIEIDKRNKRINELEEEIKRLKKQNTLLENEISKNENNNKEVVALREYIYKEENNINEESNISLEEAINDLKKYKIAIFGGRQSTINKMKQILPDYRYIGVDSINVDIKFISNFDYAIVCTNYISHAMYYKLMNNIRDTEVKLIYIDDVNVENVIKKVREYL
nr:hypothetical protein [uncultured Romboutsia sp.]